MVFTNAMILLMSVVMSLMCASNRKHSLEQADQPGERAEEDGAGTGIFLNT